MRQAHAEAVVLRREPPNRLEFTPVSSSLRQILGTTAVVIFVAAVSALAAMPLLLEKPTARQTRQKLLVELRPVALQNCRLERVGSPYDGGYLMCGNLLGNIQSAYSYGIGPADDWGMRDLAQPRRAGPSVPTVSTRRRWSVSAGGRCSTTSASVPAET